jgi:hypothetical protein
MHTLVLHVHKPTTRVCLARVSVQRRQADKFQRAQESQDVYEGRQAGTSQPGASAVASLAAISALPAPQQEIIRCELCQVIKECHGLIVGPHTPNPKLTSADAPLKNRSTL